MIEERKKRGRFGKKGCLLWVFIFLGLMVFFFWEIGEPNRRAQRVRKAVTSGMRLNEVEKMLTGRFIIFYQVEKKGVRQQLSRQEFKNSLSGEGPDRLVLRGIQITFLGMSPGRASFSVDFDESGLVTGVSKVRTWD